jgi:hypothetical protein
VRSGDLVRFTRLGGKPIAGEEKLGVLLSTRVSKWDEKTAVHRFLTPNGVIDVVQGNWTSWEVLSEAG